MRLGSLFDGSGGFPLAASMCGIEPVWASEVEPYPIAVTRSRFPNMKHLGNICKINGADIEPVDIITFGSPCQDLSVAGKRAGLKHEANGDEETTRSGLFMEAVRIIKEMREATNGEYPTFALWENVPGAFSSNKGEDFRIVCEELIKIVEPTAVMPAVPKNGWPYADSYCGDGWSLAYRVFDAQYWGVPQRRRRIHLILDLGGERAGKVSFERKGLRGHFAEGRTPWQETARDAESGFGADDREGIPYTLKIRSGCAIDAKGKPAGKGALIQKNKSGTLAASQDQYLFQSVNNLCLDDQGGQRISVCTDGNAPTLRAEAHGNLPCVLSYDARGNGDGTTINTITGDHNNRITDYTSVVVEPSSYQTVTGSLMANSHPGSYTGQDAYNDMLVVEKAHKPIVIDRAFYNQGQNAQYDPQFYTDGTVPTLVAKGPGAVCVTDTDPELPTVYGISPYYSNNMKSSNPHSGIYKAETSRTLDLNGGNPACNQGGLMVVDSAVVRDRYIVRRLTPTECARLQGFPDYWGHPDVKESMTDEEYRFWLDVRNTHAVINGKAAKDYKKDQILTWYNKLHSDGAEYKMWGNGIALPNALYVMEGIKEVTDATN